MRREFVGHGKGKVWRVIGGEWWKKKRITCGKGNKGKQNRVQQGLFVIKSGGQWHRDISVWVNSFAANNTRTLDESSDFSTSLRYRNARVDWNVVRARLENRKVDTHRSMCRNIRVIPRSGNDWAALFHFSIMFNARIFPNGVNQVLSRSVGGEKEKYWMLVPNKRMKE